MPTYEFRCPVGHDFEKFYRSIGAAPSEVRCPNCGNVAVRQMSAGGGLVFKGSGFYITDYGKDGKKSQTPATPVADSAAAKSPGESSAPKSDSTGGADSGSAAGSAPASSESKSPGESKPAAPAPAKKPKPSE